MFKKLKNILITGGAGFIGSHLVEKLLSEGDWRVTVVDDFNDFYDPQLKERNLAPFLNRENFILHRADIRDFAALEKIFASSGFESIVHLAARAGVRPSLKEPQLYTETNINGTTNLLELSHRYGAKKFVFASSSSVYGCQEKVPFAEDDPISRPISPYAATKAAGELLCHTYAHLYDLKTVCLRFFTVYGARQRPDLAIHKFAKLIWQEKPIPVFGDGSTRRDYTFVEDTLQGIRAAIDYDKTPFEIVNLGESQTVELRYLIELLEENLGKKAIIDRQPMQPGDVPQTFADITRAKEILGYNPTTHIEDGIKKFTEWFLQENAVVSTARL